MDPSVFPAHGDTRIDTPRARSTLAIMILFSILPTVFVGARFWARQIRSVRPGLDDWLIICALVFYWGEIVCVYYFLYWGGLGHHFTDLSLENLAVSAKVTFAGQFMYALAIGFARCSICALLVRIFVPRWFRITAYSTFAFNVAWMILYVIFLLARCSPFDQNYALVVETTANCANLTNFLIGVAVLGLVLDLVIWTMPLPVIFRLQMPVSQRLVVCGIFAVGIIDIIAGILRIVTIVHIDFTDETWAAVEPIQWIIIAPGIAIVVACSCVLRPVLEKILPKRIFSAKGLYSTGKSFKRSDMMSDPESQKPRSSQFGRLDDDDIELVPQKAHTKAQVVHKTSPVGWRTDDRDGVRVPESAIGVQRDVTTTHERLS